MGAGIAKKSGGGGRRGAVVDAHFLRLERQGDAQRAALEPWRAASIINARGLLVGERLPVFKLGTP